MTRILVVDDDRTTRHLLKTLLARAGYSTRVARDGVEALKHLRAQRFDLLLLDVWMPRMNGLELLARLRTRKGRPRVIVLTSDDTPETLLRAVREEAYTYVHKPVRPTALLETVRAALDAPDVPPIEVISARPEWLELLVPCTREAANRIESFLANLDTHLAPEVRHATAYAFRELLFNAIEWGGRLDPTRKVRIASLRMRRMVLYRIADPGPGFDLEDLSHAAISHSGPVAHMEVREKKGLRPGGFGLQTARGSADELIYNEKRNEVVFVKYLDG